MGQIFAMLLPCLYRTKIQKFSDIQNNRPPKLARRIKRKSSRKDAIYKAELPGAVNEHDEYEREVLQPREITLIEKVKGKIEERKIARPNQECRWIGKRRFSQMKKRVKNPKEKQTIRKTGKDVYKSPRAQNKDHEASKEHYKKIGRQQMQHDFYDVTFGAKIQSDVETTVLLDIKSNIETFLSESGKTIINNNEEACPFEETAKCGSGDHEKETSTSNSISSDPESQPFSNFQEGKSFVNELHPSDFYTATFGAKVSSSTSENEKSLSTDASREKKKNKKRSAAKLKIPSFLRRNKDSKGKNKDDIVEGKCKEENESENPNQETDSGSLTPEGNLKTIYVKPIADSSLTSVDSGCEDQTIKPEDPEPVPEPEVKRLTSVDNKKAWKPEMEIISLASIDAANEEQALNHETETPGLKPESRTADNKVSKVSITKVTSVSPRNDEVKSEPEINLKDNYSLESVEKEKLLHSEGDKLVRDDKQLVEIEFSSKKATNEKIKKKSRLFKGAHIPKLKIKRNRQKKEQTVREPEVELQEKNSSSQEIRERFTQDDEQPGHMESISKQASSEKIKKKSKLFRGLRLRKLKTKTNKQKEEKSVIKLTQENGSRSPSTSFRSTSKGSCSSSLERPNFVKAEETETTSFVVKNRVI